MTDEAMHHLILYYDVQESAKLPNPAKLAARTLLRECRDAAMQEAAIPADAASFQDTGDGELILFGARVAKVRVVGDWLGAFHRRLQRAYERSAERFQVRLSIHAGEIHPSLEGFSGDDLAFGARLVNAPEAKSVLATTPSAALAVVVSDAIYRQVVRQNAPVLDPASFAPIRVQVKETDASAWLHLPGWKRVPALPDAEGAEQAAKQPSPRHAGVADSGGGFTFHAPVHNVGPLGNTTVQGDYNAGGPGRTQ